MHRTKSEIQAEQMTRSHKFQSSYATLEGITLTW